MKKITRFVAGFMACIMAFSPLTAMATSIAVKTSNYVISELSVAKTALEKLTNERQINAAIYLKDVYTIKSEADAYSEDIANISSGQTVEIKSVAVDAGRNIWYQVSYSYAGGNVSGYIEREFLACADERFLEWEDKYITTLNREEISKNSNCADIEQFPESYKDALYTLKKKHPNWVFVRQNVGLSWSDVIYQETLGERSLVSANVDSSYKGTPSTGTAGWYNASEGIIKYYMDPRNFLDETRVFMFEMLTYNPESHTESAVQKVLDGTFMSGNLADANISYAKTFVNIGASQNINPIMLASRVRQEQGVSGTSPLISGTYPGYEGYYNHFNFKANGATYAQVYENGLKYAKEQGWNSITKSLSGGAGLVAKNYIKRGQDTIYLQKFDVDASDGTLYTHQYMQNISAPYSESASTYKSYANIGQINNTFVFKIPVYNNMPKGRCIKPNATDVISIDVEEVKNLPVDQNAVLNTFINGGQNTDVAMNFTSSNPGVATIDQNGVITAIKPGSTTIKVNRAENVTNTVTCKVMVIKADVAISKVEIPTLEVIYKEGQTLNDIELPYGFAWVNSELMPIPNNEGYSVIYSPDNSKYNEITLTVPVTVNRAVVNQDELVLPANLKGETGTELSSVVLPDGYVWVDSEQLIPAKTGTYKFDAIYAEDPALYQEVKLSLSVTAYCADHKFGIWTGEDADCINDGVKTRKCISCGYTEIIKENAKGHDYIVRVTTEPTVKNDGERTYTCSLCGDTYSEVIPKLQDKHIHEYVESVTKEPGCLENGIKTFNCECGDSYIETIAFVGHEYDDRNICKSCGYELPVIPVHIHNFSLSSTTATCTEAGENTFACGCGETYTEVAKAVGHNIKNGKCSVCEYAVPTEAPKPTATPTVAPVVTEAPKPTATPKVTPVVTEEPKPTATPKVTPVVTEAPKPAATSTVAPVVTEEPKPAATSTVAPVVTKAPNNTENVSQTTKKEPDTKTSEVVATPEIEKIDTFSDEDNPIETVMLSSTILNEDKILELTSSDNRKLKITMVNDVVWDVDLTDVDITSVDVNLEVKLGEADIPEETIRKINVKDINPYEVISIAHEGEFGFPVTMHIPSKLEYVGKEANLFYYNPVTDELEFIDSSIVSGNGDAAFRMEHASEYVIIYADSSLNPSLTKELERVEVEKYESKEMMINSEEDDVSSNMNVIKNVVLIISGIVIVALVITISCTIIKSKKQDDYYFDEEDEDLE